MRSQEPTKRNYVNGHNVIIQLLMPLHGSVTLGWV